MADKNTPQLTGREDSQHFLNPSPEQQVAPNTPFVGLRRPQPYPELSPEQRQQYMREFNEQTKAFK